LVKAETEVGIQYLMLNNLTFHKIACLGHSSSLKWGFASYGLYFPSLSFKHVRSAHQKKK